MGEFINGNKTYSSLSSNASQDLRLTILTVEGILAVVIMAVAMLSIYLALRKKEGCLFRSKKWKICEYAFFILESVPIIVMSFMMYNLITTNIYKLDQSSCAVKNY